MVDPKDAAAVAVPFALYDSKDDDKEAASWGIVPSSAYRVTTSTFVVRPVYEGS